MLAILLLVMRCVLGIPINGSYSECPPNQDVCEYWLQVEFQLTMNHKGYLVYPDKGQLYKIGEFPNNFTTHVPTEEVVSVDGFHRLVKTVNGTIPGPPIVVYEHQTVIIHVKNLLHSESLTLHWHGLHQRGTPYMDGVPYITQCPIGPGQHFTYKFKAEPRGTFWYHSHIGLQRTDGVYGAFIIKEKPKPGHNIPADMIMQVGDWDHVDSEEVHIKNAKLDFYGIPFKSALIEGKGRYVNSVTGAVLQAPLTWYKIKKDEKYRFRVINVGGVFSFRISVDNHKITISSSDGYDLKPTEFESFIVSPGERFDFFLQGDQPIGNYWIRAVEVVEFPMPGYHAHSVEAILQYEGASDNEPTTSRKICTKDQPCDVLNCQMLRYPVQEHLNCSLISDMENSDVNDDTPLYEDDSEEHFLNFNFPGTEPVPPASVNGHIFKPPGVNSLTQRNELGPFSCSKKDCGKDKVCSCNHEIEVSTNKTVQMVLFNSGFNPWIGHPIHLHGHSFHVLKIAYHNTSVIGAIDCGDGDLNYCNEAKWKNPNWNNGNIPGMNIKNSPRKDTIFIPIGGYAVIRLRTDNPGKWILHCHSETHALDGMAIVLSENLHHLPPTPNGFPTCKNFDNNDNTNDDNPESYFPVEIRKEFQKDCQTNVLMIKVSIGLGVVVLLQGVIIFYCAIKSRTKTHATIDQPIHLTGGNRDRSIPHT